MKAEQECQQKKTQQTQPELGETSGERPSTSILKVKSQKGKTVEVMQVEVDKAAEKKLHEPSPEIRDRIKKEGQIREKRLTNSARRD